MCRITMMMMMEVMMMMMAMKGEMQMSADLRPGSAHLNLSNHPRSKSPDDQDCDNHDVDSFAFGKSPLYCVLFSTWQAGTTCGASSQLNRPRIISS